jgi:signal transduction histidine kinase
VPDDVPLAAQPRALSRWGGQGRQGGHGRQGDHVGPGDGIGWAGRTDGWLISLSRWDLFYALVLAATIAVVVGSTSESGQIVALAALAAMAPWYLLAGRPLMSGEAAATLRPVVYLAGVVALFAVADVLAPNAWFMCIALNPQCYHVTTPRRALAAVVVMSCIGATSVGLANEGQPHGIVAGICLAIFSIAFSIAYGGYMTKIIEKSDERAVLITQLEATRAELADVSRQAGALAERQRLAGEIHDTLAQGFSSILMLIQAADAQVDHKPDTAHAQLALAAQTARENLADARTLVTGLASAQLEAGTLTNALRRLTERSAAELGITMSFQASGPERPLPAATEVVLLRTGQEALANVRKHAAATTVAVRLRYAADQVQLEVTDDGVGFDPAVVNGGYGLRGMRVRLTEAGGSVTVKSAPGKGTAVRAEVPA